MQAAKAVKLGFRDGVVFDVVEGAVASRLATDGDFEPPHAAAKRPRATASAVRASTPFR